MAEILLLTGAMLTAFWGVAHLFPTRPVVEGFGDISLDNRRIITMEWITEGVSLIFIGSLVAAVTLTERAAPVSAVVYYSSAAAMIVLAIVSLATGFKVNFLPYKLCPVIFALSALLFIVGAMS
jgi:hypothetical protein